MYRFIFILIIGLFLGCQPEEPHTDGPYFPSNSSSQWDTVDPDSLGWDVEGLEELYTFHQENNSRAFIVLQDGKIVVEQYWDKDLLGILDFSKNSIWYWASAGKTLTATAVGLAQQENYLSIDDPTSDYLGPSWATFPNPESDQIQIRHQLSMTTGFDISSGDLTCMDPECLIYDLVPDQRWYYHNAPYTLLQDVITQASDIEFEEYLEEELLKKIGAEGNWNPSGNNNVFYSTARDAARFGLFILNEGSWNGEQILSDENYFNEMTNSSQLINPAYGYLWWLNGKNKITLPGSTASFNAMLTPDGPQNMISAMGKNGQFIDVLPDENMVVIRFGQTPDDDLVPITFHNDMWDRISDIIE